VTTTGVSNGSPLICPIIETFNSFSEASSGPNGAEFSRVVGGIHTPFAVEDALTVGDGIGQEVATGAGLPDVLPEPSTLSLYAVSLLALTRLRRRVMHPERNASGGRPQRAGAAQPFPSWPRTFPTSMSRVPFSRGHDEKAS
jgi:hypothetical protein